MAVLHPYNFIFQYLLRLFGYFCAAGQVVLEPLFVLLCFFPQFQNLLLRVSFRVDALGVTIIRVN